MMPTIWLICAHTPSLSQTNASNMLFKNVVACNVLRHTNKIDVVTEPITDAGLDSRLTFYIFLTQMIWKGSRWPSSLCSTSFNVRPIIVQFTDTRGPVKMLQKKRQRCTRFRMLGKRFVMVYGLLHTQPGIYENAYIFLLCIEKMFLSTLCLKGAREGCQKHIKQIVRQPEI